MDLKIKTVVTWKSLSDMGNHSIIDARKEKLESMKAEGKTDGYINRNDLIGTIYFIDNESAQEYIDFLKQLTTNNGIELASVEIESD
jgi:hypothetical protein